MSNGHGFDSPDSSFFYQSVNTMSTSMFDSFVMGKKKACLVCDSVSIVIVIALPQHLMHFVDILTNLTSKMRNNIYSCCKK